MGRADGVRVTGQTGLAFFAMNQSTFGPPNPPLFRNFEKLIGFLLLRSVRFRCFLDRVKTRRGSLPTDLKAKPTLVKKCQFLSICEPIPYLIGSLKTGPQNFTPKEEKKTLTPHQSEFSKTLRIRRDLGLSFPKPLRFPNLRKFCGQGEFFSVGGRSQNGEGGGSFNLIVARAPQGC